MAAATTRRISIPYCRYAHYTVAFLKLDYCCSSAVENLLQQGFTPKRTIVLAFGIDEESAGTEVRRLLILLTLALILF